MSHLASPVSLIMPNVSEIFRSAEHPLLEWERDPVQAGITTLVWLPGVFFQIKLITIFKSLPILYQGFQISCLPFILFK